VTRALATLGTELGIYALPAAAGIT
jgi:hypothetical protein